MGTYIASWVRSQHPQHSGAWGAADMKHFWIKFQGLGSKGIAKMLTRTGKRGGWDVCNHLMRYPKTIMSVKQKSTTTSTSTGIWYVNIVYYLQYCRLCTDRKENKIFLIYKEIQKGAVEKSYRTNGLLICDWISICMRKIFFSFLSVCSVDPDPDRHKFAGSGSVSISTKSDA